MVATPKAEIDRQYQEALRLVNEGLECCAEYSTDVGEISLNQKQYPAFASAREAAQPQQELMEEKKETDSRSSSENNNNSSDGISPLVCISSRGRVDTSRLEALVREGYNDDMKKKQESTTGASFTSLPTYSSTNLWNETNASVNNVKITRPSHDAWGINKIVFIFCDDFLQDVYELPWWHSRSDVRQAVQPILDCLAISPRRIVRMLLAALPPNVTIPIHHDTGEWVKHTHRVHVPVIVTDPTRVLFTCGPTPSTVKRVDCTPGHVFELNNQAKHAVSNCGADHRVHLILDYVDADFDIKRRLRLQPGERLVQTRRSIDRLAERGSRPTPSFMILGAQKAGTTSLYEYMVQHPLVVRAKRRETHCLDWRWKESMVKAKRPSRDDFINMYYHAKELLLHPSCMTGDSTPSYLLDSRRVIPRLKQLFPHSVKFFVVMRDPVARAQSHYAMVTSLDGTPAQIKTRGTEWRQLTLLQVIRQDLSKMQECGLIPYWNIDAADMDLSKFRDFCGSPQEDEAWELYMSKHIPLNTGSHSLITRGMYELQLRAWYRAFDASDILCLKLEDMMVGGNGVHATLEKVWAHAGLPQHQVQDDAPKNTRSYAPMPSEAREYLEKFYAPHNDRLASLLGGEWLNPW